MTIMTRCMKDSDDDNEFSLDAVYDSIRKAGWQEPADIPAAVADVVSQRICRKVADGLADDPHELKTRPRYALLIPRRRFFDIYEGVRADFEAVAHSP